MAMIILFILAAIMLFVTTSTLSSRFQTKRKTERSTGMAAGDSAIERIRAALNAHLMDESDGYSLNEADLTTLVSDRADSKVLSNATSSDRWGMSKVLVPLDEAFTVRESADRGYQYWQIVSVHEPRYRSDRSSDLVVYIRAWATEKKDMIIDGTNMTTQPRLFRAEFRPGYFSDYQSISDGPFFTQPSNPQWEITGPVHTNGFQGEEWITQGKSGYDLAGPTKCSGRARLTASQGAPVGHLSGCGNALGSTKARQISLLNVDKTLGYMRTRCGVPHGVHCFFDGQPYTGGQSINYGNGGSQKSYDIRLSPEGVHVFSGGRDNLVPLEPDVRCANTPTDCGDGAMAAVLVDGDVNLSGTTTGGVGKAGRVTIATMRQNADDQAARVWIEPAVGTVGSADTDIDTVGVISQGDIIMGIRPGQCGSAINIAGIAQSGSVTMPRELVTLNQPNVPSIQSYVCPRMDLTGSFSMHGPLISNMSWLGMGVTQAGYQQLGFTYQKALFDNPPPFFATTYGWAMTKVKDADKRCLESKASDPRCQ